MAVNRRTVVASLMAAALLPGCADAGTAAAPASPWTGFRDRFMAADGRIVDTGNGGVSHSEGQGYGMLAAEAYRDRAGFDLLWTWTQHMLLRPDGLFSWRHDPRPGAVADPNNATDGDILIAWALLRAAKRWPDGGYARASAKIRAAILATLVQPFGGRTILLPALAGFTAADHVTLNLSYYIWPALDAFAVADGAGWRTVTGDGEALLRDAGFGPHRLPSDWIDLARDGSLVPARGRPPRFGFDAIRVPLYLAWSGRRAPLAPFAAFWSGYDARQVPIPAWIDVTTGEVAPFALSPGARATADITQNKPFAPATADPDYYSAALSLLAGIVRHKA